MEPVLVHLRANASHELGRITRVEALDVVEGGAASRFAVLRFIFLWLVRPGSLVSEARVSYGWIALLVATEALVWSKMVWTSHSHEVLCAQW